MKIDVYTATGTKKGTADLSAALFGAPVNESLMHQALLRQRGNRRHAIAHVKSRGEIRGSTRKLFAQKGTGRARRGSVRSPLLRGGGKAFGPRKRMNFSKHMPRAMRRAALRSCLSLQAKNGKILGLENYPTEIKTKTFVTLLGKMPVEQGRSILFVLPEARTGLQMSARNVPNVKTINVAYLNPEDILGAHHIVFLVDALQKAEELFGKAGAKKAAGTAAKKPAAKSGAAKTKAASTAKKTAAKKTSATPKS